LFLLLWLPCGARAVEVGKPAPGFTLQDLAGKSVSLTDFKGKVVLLKLATTWCPSCSQLSRELAVIGDFLKEKDVVLLEVFLQDSPEMITRYFEGKSFPMVHHILIDDDMQAYKGYNIYLIPRLLVVDREQRVRYDNGAAATILPAAEIRKLVEGALQG
jgi:peroxiredoxin